MEWLPELKLGWSNGWLLLGVFYMIFGVLMLLTPKDIVAKLFSVSGWSRQQVIFSAIGKPFSLACLGTIIFSPLKLGQNVFMVGCVVFLVGFTGMMIALSKFRSTPSDQPVQNYLKRVPRYFIFL